MSQFYQGVTAGALPVVVPTSFVTDVNSPSVPLLNIENLVGGTTTSNNNNGIRSDGSSGSNTVTLQLTNRASVTGTTVGATTTTVALFTPTTGTAIAFRTMVIGYDSAGAACVGGEQSGIARALAGTVTVIGTNDTLDEADASLIATDWDVVASSPTISMQFVGVAGITINWRALFEYTQVS